MKKIFLILLITNNFYLITYAQKQVSEKAMAAYFKAKEFVQKTQWEEAIIELDKAIKFEPEFIDAKELLADSYFALKKNNECILTLESCITSPLIRPRSYFLLSEAYLRVNKIENAKKYAEKYLAQPKVMPLLGKKASQTIRNGNFNLEAKKNPVPFNPKNLGPNINTKNWEYFPYMTPDGKWLAFSRIEFNQEDLYIAQKTDSGFTKAISFGSNINSDENEGAETMNAEGNILFFTSCNKMDGYGSCDIYYASKINGNWTKPQGIGKPINSSAWEAQPSFSSDAKALYFTSNRKGGFGGKDIWVSYLDENLKFGEPINLGASVNTVYDDQCPFIHADNQTLYFTSDGWPGMGQGDVFMSRKVDTGWTAPQNLGFPINTETDDNALTVSYDGKTAFMASNREGGFGGLDIYSFDLPESVQPQKTTFIKAIIKDAKTKQLINANYVIEDLENNKIINKGNSTNSSFFINIQANKNYALQVQKDKYLFYSQNINLKETTKVKPYELEILLDPIGSNTKIILNNVFFEFDKSNLQTNSFFELDKVAELLQKNPTIKIEIAGHTDNKGDKKYNQSLSQKRAESVVNYLIQKGIVKTRLVAKGYGDTMPIAPNDTEDNKAKNRRTEAKVL